MASSLTNALFSALTLSQLSLTEAGVAGIMWSIYFLTIAFAKGATVFNGTWDADAWSPWNPDLLALLALPGLGGGVALAATGYGLLGLACMALGPVLLLAEIVRQQSLVGDGVLAVRLDLFWLLLSMVGFGCVWAAELWTIDILFVTWAGSAVGAMLLVIPQASAQRPRGEWRVSPTTGAEHLVAGAALSLVVLMTGVRFGLADVATVRLLQLSTTPVRLVQAAAQPVLFGQHQRARLQSRPALQRRQAAGLIGTCAVLLLPSVAVLALWPTITGRGDLSVTWPTFAWYSAVILVNTALMPAVAKLRSSHQTGLLLRWRIWLLAASIVSFVAAPDLTYALAGLSFTSMTLARLLRPR